MSAFDDTILVLEDRDEYDDLLSEIREAESVGLSIVDPDLDRDFGGQNGREAVENLMEEIGGYPLLTVLDWDLSMGDGPITRDNIVSYCETNHIPLCVYHRMSTGLSDERAVQEYEESRFKVDPTSLADAGSKVGHIANGLHDITTTISEVFDGEGDQPLPDLLDAPITVRGKLDQYSWGNPGVIKSGQTEVSQDELVRRATTNQGYWILNELLEFPGALLNETALAAYLNVDHERFEQSTAYRVPFEDAKYSGPFGELHDWWWTPSIHEIRVEQMDEEDAEPPLGPELFDRLGTPEIDVSHCTSDRGGGHEGARYYCIIKETPVCEEHSTAPEGWIPKGATRSRVSEEEYDRLKPWVMM
jgi:hypothetical protein